jgi:hypothetical protein
MHHGQMDLLGPFFCLLRGHYKRRYCRSNSSFLPLELARLAFSEPSLCRFDSKKNYPHKVSDYRPISLTHGIAKLLSKLLANRLALELNHMISVNQTAFIKKRCIHDNFMYVQQVVKDLHRRKIPAMFIKLDIFRAFDLVNWPYMLGILQHLGFGPKWRSWISSLWCTASSCFLVNGEPGTSILH